MKFNLIDEKWISVKRKDKTTDRITTDWISPWEVTDDFEKNPVVALDAPRPDFNGALIQFLIGLVQTTFAPANRIEWKQKLRTAPSPDQLKTAFMTVHPAFELGGDGPRFMQDFQTLNGATLSGIAGLLIDAPGINALVNNTDHFIKRGTVDRICLCCCATALFTSQINAYGDGPGYRTSLRGGSGPLTTLILGDERHNTLWHLIWLNVLEQATFLNLSGNQKKTRQEDSFPWIAQTRTSEKHAGVETCPMDVHPAQMFWSMSQRIKLMIDESLTGTCDLCGSLSTTLISSYNKKNNGVNYVGSWLHPLTPYSRKKDGTTLPAHGTLGGIVYRHWLGYVQKDNANNKEPARVVHEFYDRQNPDWQFRLWIFGYDIYKKAKIRCWYDAKMPLITVKKEYATTYEDRIASLIKAANIVCGNIKIAIKRALHGKPEVDPKTKRIKWKYQDIKNIPAEEEKEREKVLYHKSVKEKTLFMEVETHFWQKTESAFYITLIGVKEALESGNDYSAALRSWHHALCSEAINQFDVHIFNGPVEDVDIKKASLARKELNDFNKGTFVKSLLGL